MCRVLGCGRSGTVFLAKHMELDEYRAIKRVPKTFVDYELFRKEALILKGIRDQGIPIVYDLAEDDQYSYLIEEYLEGDSLYALVSESGHCSSAMTIRYGIQICHLVHIMHSTMPTPVLYLDLQPKNLLLYHNTIKLIDFDHAGEADSASLQKERYGTAGCAAPELYTTDQSLDQRTDIYAIGAVLHFMLYGTLNAGAGTDCRAEVSKPLQNVIRKCMEPDREKRYASAKELEQALEGSVWSGRMVSAHKKAVSSLNIVITGSTPGAGVTHLAFGLCTILTKMGIKVLYEEKNQTGALRRMAEKEGVTRMDHFGIYHIRGCQMKPWYGPAIRLEEKTDVQVIIKDFGTDWEDAARELKEEKHFLAAVISENLWEYGNAKRMLEIMKISGNNKEIPVFFIWRHRHRKKGADMTLGCSPVLFCTPEYADPFHPGPEGAGFLTSLFNCIQEHCIQKTAKDRMGAKRRFPWSIQHRLWG